jgi:prepilin-type N-terminal cleavage/methylation domain-containing protein
MKKNGGFTLVELIIVIAILAILSTGAIAGYSAYIKSANDAAVNSVLGEVYTSAALANAQGGPITEIVVAENSDVWTVTIEADNFDDDGFVEMFAATMKAKNGKISGTTYTCTIEVNTNWEASKTYAGKNAKWTAAEGWKAVQ